MKQILLRILAVFFLVGYVANAQVTTSSINGSIIDAKTKEELIGAAVVARHLPSGTVYGVATNAKGNYLLQGLRPGGPYRIEVSYLGYQTTTINDVTLALGDTETINISLQDDTNTLETLVVTATSRSAAFNASRTGAGSSFNRKAIERTPTTSRSIFDIAKLTPQASSSSGGASFAGSSNKYNSFQIDGTVNNDVFGLSGSGTNGGQAGTTPISLEAIEAVQVVIAPFDVRQGGFTGGGINAITKSGTNTFSGSLYDYYYNQDFYGTTAGKDVANRKKINEQYSNILGVTLGGPIIKDKLFFFVNGEMTKQSYPAEVYLDQTDSPLTTAVANSVVERLNQLQPGFNSGGFGSRDVPTTSYKALARIDWNINQAHRLSLRYSFVDAKKLIFSNSATALNFLSRGYTFNSRTHSIVAELNSRFGQNINNELRLGYNRIRDFRQPEGLAPSIAIELGNRNYINLGAEPNSVANQLDQDIYTLTDNLTITSGNHTITVGTHNELFNLYNLYINSFAGAYTYANLNDFLTGASPKEYTYSYAQESITGTKRWGPRFSAAQLALYVQDEWKATDNLRLTYGLRADLPLFLDEPRANEFFNSSALAAKYGVQNHTMPKTRILWSPRIGFRYTLDETRRDLIRGGVGIFTGRVPFVWISNSFGNSGVEMGRTRITNFTGYPDFAFSLDPNNQYIDTKAGRPVSEINMVSKDFRFPQVLRANLAFETTLPGGVRATLEGMITKNLNNIRYQNLMVEATGNTLDHGSVERPLYRTLSSSNAATPYTYLILMSNTNKGISYNFTAQLAKDFDFGLSTSVAYTYGRAKSVHDGGSSQASSAWRYNYIFADPNGEEMFNSNFDLRHRIVATANYRIEYGKHFATTIGLVYNGQSGSRYNVIYNGDINGDGQFGNDLLYVPTSEDIKNMKFANLSVGSRTVSAADMPAALDAYLSAHPELSQLRGQVAPRNGFSMPFSHQFDLHLAQDFFINVGGRRHTLQLNADIINVGNLINRGWGLSYGMTNYNTALLGYNNRTGAYTFDTATSQTLWYMADISSRWHAQVGVKYIF